MKRIIGLTGGTGAGKSTVAKMLQKNGAYIIDADKISRELCEKGKEGYLGIKEAFGKEYFDEKGELDRRKLGQLVFAEESERLRLERLLHPLIERETKRRAKDAGELCVIDAPLLYYAGLDKLCSEVWSVSADGEIRAKRIMLRDGISAETAKNRMNSQQSQEAIDKRADVVIKNNGDESEVQTQVLRALKCRRQKEYSR